MTLENTFYTLGIIYIVGSIIVLIAVVTAIIVLIYKINKAKNDFKKKLRVKELSLMGFKAAIPVVITSFTGWLATQVFNKRR